MRKSFSILVSHLTRASLRLLGEVHSSLSNDPIHAIRKMHDLGYHHAIRGLSPDFDYSSDVDYKRGYEAGKHRAAKASQSDSVDSSEISGLGSHGIHAGWESLRANYDANDIKDSMAKAAYSAKTALSSKGYKFGRLLGAGLNGHVYASGKPGVVTKIDKGDNEARLAKFAMNDPEMQQLRGLPKYYSTEPTGVADGLSGKELHAINREDLADLPDEVGLDKHAQWTFRALRDQLNQIGHDISAGRISPQNFESKIAGRLESTGALDRAARVHPKFKPAIDDLRRMIKRGVVPCDMHLSNWGVRPSTGEFVMRDLGCFSVVNRGQS